MPTLTDFHTFITGTPYTAIPLRTFRFERFDRFSATGSDYLDSNGNGPISFHRLAVQNGNELSLVLNDFSFEIFLQFNTKSFSTSFFITKYIFLRVHCVVKKMDSTDCKKLGWTRFSEFLFQFGKQIPLHFIYLTQIISLENKTENMN